MYANEINNFSRENDKIRRNSRGSRRFHINSSEDCTTGDSSSDTEAYDHSGSDTEEYELS